MSLEKINSEVTILIENPEAAVAQKATENIIRSLLSADPADVDSCISAIFGVALLKGIGDTIQARSFAELTHVLQADRNITGDFLLQAAAGWKGREYVKAFNDRIGELSGFIGKN